GSRQEQNPFCIKTRLEMALPFVFIISIGSKLAPHAALDFADGALNPALDQRGAWRPFEDPAEGSPRQAAGHSPK
ncbi:MAG: hypothetical protein JXL20_12870, partial [Deltaproteobacteria bacterium]|nr:hypothetical protein [Deltaproteobacteria bacterium]